MDNTNQVINVLYDRLTNKEIEIVNLQIEVKNQETRLVFINEILESDPKLKDLFDKALKKYTDDFTPVPGDKVEKNEDKVEKNETEVK